MRISIVTTCFNSAATIEETIKSVLGQQGDFQLEFIITDAGSTDGTVEIIKRYEDKLCYLPAEGLNQSEGINLGVQKSTGDIIAFLNSDDLYHSGALQKVVLGFKKNPSAQWLVGSCSIIDEKGKEIHSFISHYKEFLRRRYSYFLLLTENFICQPAVFWRRSIYEECGGLAENEQYAMDYEYWLRIGRKYKPLNVFVPLAAFRRMATSKSNKGFKTQFKDDLRLGLKFAKETGNYLAIPLKLINYVKIISLYSLIYR
jgi:glycosyltransferase involved in cell wall biosynthesis